MALNFTSIDPIKHSIGAQSLNGVLAAPLMTVMMVMATESSYYGATAPPRPMLIVGWIATLVMALATIGSALI